MSMNHAQAAENPLSQHFTIKSLLKFALPTILMMIFMGLYTIVDTIFVARFVNTNALSAFNIVCPVMNLIVGLGTMLATGGSAIVARKMGAGEHTRASQDFTLIICSGALLSPSLELFLLTGLLGDLVQVIFYFHIAKNIFLSCCCLLPQAYYKCFSKI